MQVKTEIKRYFWAAVAVRKVDRAIRSLDKAERYLKKACNSAINYHSVKGDDKSLVIDLMSSHASLLRIRECLGKYRSPSDIFEVRDRVERMHEKKKNEEWLKKELGNL